MWCPTCQRDCSPARSAGQERNDQCGHCGTTVGPAREELPAPTDVQRPNQAVSLPDEDWALEADVRSVQRLVASLKQSSRIDVATMLPRSHVPAKAHKEDEAQRDKAIDSPPVNFAAWLLLSLGLATFVCGAVLLGWSFATDREDLWPLGMPLALAGQAALIVGLVLQLDGLWRTSRKTEETLSVLDGELSKVRQATTLLSSSHSGPSQSFYLHMAEGASPQLLLADLKGQLDLLAQQMRK